MGFKFVHQPYPNGFDLRDYMSEVANGGFTQLDIVSAWVKRSGVGALRSQLTGLRGQGAYIRSVIGISLGGTSIQGLQELVALSDEAYVFHQKGRTFHPKVYRASSSTEGLTLVGSHNLTAGGAANNFEAGTLGRLDLSDPADSTYHQSVKDYVDALIADTSVCRLIDAALLQSLIANNRYRLIDDTQPVRTGDDPDEPSGGAVTLDPELFGNSSNTLRTVSSSGPTGAAGGGAGTTSPTGGGSSSTAPPAAGVAPVASGAHVTRRWFKKLGSIDAQQGTSPNWNPSNTMTLVDGGHPIDRTTYFRQQFFGGASWVNASTASGKPRESATVDMEVFVGGSSIGLHQFEVRHTPDYDAGQSNRVTELQWGTLKTHMRSSDHTGDTVTLEKLSDGSFRLHLAPTESGPFIY